MAGRLRCLPSSQPGTNKSCCNGCMVWRAWGEWAGGAWWARVGGVGVVGWHCFGYHQPPGTPSIIVPIAMRRYTDSVSVIPTWVLHPRRDRHIG